MKLSSYAVAAFSWLSGAQEQIPLQADHHNRPTNIAIIGAGAGGASTAYFLSKYAQNASIPLNITVFDRNAYVGGRSTTVSAYNDTSLPVELGASIFVEINHILVDAANEFGLSTAGSLHQYHADGSKVPGAQLAIWDGEKIVLTANGGWFDLAKLFWKYGWATIKTQKLMKKVVGKFMELYEEPIFPFASLTQAAQDTGLLAVTAATGEQYMRENGITGPFGREVVQASTRVNYAQNLGYIHGLEAMVCMATDGAMAIEGGNWRIFDEMVKSSGAHLKLETEVGGIWPQGHGKYALNYTDSDGTGSGSHLFDAVVLAAPYQYSQLKSLGVASGQHHPDEVPYVELHVTLFTSPHLLSPEFFNMPADKPAPRVVLTTLPEGEPARKGKSGVGSPGFFSVSLLRPIINPNTSQQEYLYKIFSPDAPDSEFLANLLGVKDLPGGGKEIVSGRDITWIYRKIWNSYPYEYPRVTFEDPKLGKNLWYTSGMDSFISTMETNALMGKNVARLMVDEMLGKDGGHTTEGSMLAGSITDSFTAT